MKYTFLIITILVLFANTYAQKKMTDREFAGFKGQVKSVLNEAGDLEEINGKIEPDPRRNLSEDIYDEQGNITKNVYIDGVSADTFSLVNGVKTQKSSDVKNAESQNTKYKYGYDEKGRIIEERKYDNRGIVFFKSVYKYNEKGQVIEETLYAKDKMTSDNFYTYDAQGNLTEKKFQILETTYRFKDYKFDAQGNWIQRTQSTSSRLDGKDYTEATIYYRTIRYY